MGIFDRFKTSEVAKARRVAESNPNPSTIEGYCRALIASDRLEDALTEATTGLQRFPDNERLVRVVKHVRKQQLAPQVAELKEHVRTKPSPVLYRQLAELYRDIGDDQKALDTCMEVRERYPKDENTFLVAGEIYFDRFQLAFLASDGRSAIENLGRACTLNRNNYNALLKLAQVYINIGYFTKAIPCLRTITNFAPADRVVKHLLARSVEFSSSGYDDDDVDYLLRCVEEQEAPFFRVEYDPHGGGDIRPAKDRKHSAIARNVIERELEHFELSSTYRGIVAFDHTLTPTFHRFFGGAELSEQSLEAAQLMVDVLVKQAPRLAMGSLREAQLDTRAVGARVFYFGDFFFVLLLGPDARPEIVDQKTTDLIGRLSG